MQSAGFILLLAAGFILLLAAGVIMLFGGASPRANEAPQPIVPLHTGLLLH